MEIYLDDFHLHSTTTPLHTLVKRPVQGLEGGAPRVSIYDNPGQSGQTISQIFAGGSVITLDGSLRSITGESDQEKLDDYTTARKALLDGIRFEYNTQGRIQPRTLKITMPNGDLYQATVYRTNWKAPLEYNTYSKWMLELSNPAGVIESQTETVSTITLPLAGGVVYPVAYPVVYAPVSGGSSTLTNYGDAEAKPVITFYGPMENPVLTNDSTGKFLRLNMTIDSGQIVVARMATPSILQGTLSNPPSTNRMDAKATGSSFWGLQPGANVLRLRATTYDLGYATIAYRSTWSGL